MIVWVVGRGLEQREGYASELAGLWTDLSTTLLRLERIAADPVELEESLDLLPALQYGLHRASELAAGIAPPHGAEAEHRELAAALEDARDLTGEIADGEPGLFHEWRGSLFRVRLARHRLARPPQQPEPAVVGAEEPPAPFPVSALIATGLAIVGTAVFTGGALLAMWPLWAAGLVIAAAGVVVYRP